MSKQNALLFIHKVSGNTDLQDQLKAISGNADALCKIGAEAGYAFSVDDWNAATADIVANRYGELSEADMGGVVGGIQNLYSWSANFIVQYNLMKI